MSERYTYRRKSDGHIGRDFSSKSPATSALYRAIRYGTNTARCPSEQEVKEIAKRDYELVTYVLVEKSALESLQEDSDELGLLEAYGVDNWQGYYDAINDTEGVFKE